jgi:formylglycine-generating enzyme required for sulfatase activity
MVVQLAGTFVMPSADNPYGNKAPEGEVTFAEPFAFGKNIVTHVDWDVCADAGACPRRPADGLGRDRGM